MKLTNGMRTSEFLLTVGAIALVLAGVHQKMVEPEKGLEFIKWALGFYIGSRGLKKLGEGVGGDKSGNPLESSSPTDINASLKNILLPLAVKIVRDLGTTGVGQEDLLRYAKERLAEDLRQDARIAVNSVHPALIDEVVDHASRAIGIGTD